MRLRAPSVDGIGKTAEMAGRRPERPCGASRTWRRAVRRAE